MISHLTHKFISLKGKIVNERIFRNDSENEFELRSGQVVAYGLMEDHLDLIIPKSEQDLKYLAGVVVTNGNLKLRPKERVEVDIIVAGEIPREQIIFPDYPEPDNDDNKVQVSLELIRRGINIYS